MNDNLWRPIEALIQQAHQPIPDEWLQSLGGFPERLNYYHFLYRLVEWWKPEVTIEIGVETGVASAYMAAAASRFGGLGIGIDINAEYGLPINVLPKRFNYIYVQADSTKCFDTVKELCGERKVGLVYQDSSHHYVPSKKEFELYSQLLVSPAIWICDDITPSFYEEGVDPPGKGMVQYFDELPGDKRIYQDVLHYGNRQGIVIL